MSDRKPYLIINSILAGIIGVIFIYSGFFSADKDNHPVPSFFEEITGQPAPSSGMSRAFSEILRGNPESAREYNEDSPLIFTFFLIQCVQRLLVSLLLIIPLTDPGRRARSGLRLQKKHLLLADVLITIVLFLYCFQRQIGAMIRLLG